MHVEIKVSSLFGVVIFEFVHWILKLNVVGRGTRDTFEASL